MMALENWATKTQRKKMDPLSRMLYEAIEDEIRSGRMTQEEIARQSGVQSIVLSRFRRGQKMSFTTESIWKLMPVLGLEITRTPRKSKK